MGDIHKIPPLTAESKNVLPDVVHSQQIPAEGTAVTDTEASQIDTPHDETGTPLIKEDDSQTESISEHIPSKLEYSITESDNAGATQSGLLQVGQHDTDPSRNSSLNMPVPSPSDNPSTQDPSKSTSWPEPKSTDIHHISEESPVNLASESVSKDTHETPQAEERSQHEKTQESPRSDKYLDSLNEETYPKSNASEDEKEVEKHSHSSVSPPLSLSVGEDSLKQASSDSEEIIKLDIRGHGAPKFPLSAAKIIFGPPPEGSHLVDEEIQPLPVFQTLMSPFLVGAGEMKVEELFDEKESQVEMEKDSLSSIDKIEQSDLLVEEVVIDDTKEKLQDESMPSMPQPKSLGDTMSFSTMTTDYKTICEEFQAKLVHLESAITKRDALIEELTVTLQRSIRERDALALENQHLCHEMTQRENSEHDTIKQHLSDYAKYESMLKEDTKYYSALMSSGSSAKSSNGEKDNDREEMTVNYSKSDLKSDSDDFQGFETKLNEVINKFDESIEENLRNKIRESLIQVLCDEIARIRIESDTDVKELETQLRQDKHAFNVETRRLRELLASVKAGDADIEELREELDRKHEKEMENLRMYFEKKCSDMERSYSEEVYRGRLCASPQSASSLEAPNEAGDGLRRRTRSADLPSLTSEMPPLEFAVKQANRRADIQQLEDVKAEHAALVKEMQDQYRLTVTALQEQINQLKAHVQTAENTESNVSLYQQDIDLELEKDAKFEKRLEEAKQEVIQHLQEQIQVLLSDPDAELSSWPLELVALRDKIHDARPEKELSSLREEAGEADKWKQRRHTTFDQNRHLEEVTKERDSFKRVATSLQRIVGQLVAYCAAAEDELNRTVLAELLSRLLPEASLIEEPRPSTPNLDISVRNKHVHFAPDLSVLADLDSEGVAGFLQGQRDVSIDIKRELELSLRRLREEAQELLETAARVKGKPVPESPMLESSQVQITELVEQLDSRHNSCDNCELHRKNMEEAMMECLQRENLLRSDLEAALMKVAQLMQPERHSCDLVVEGYGTGQHRTPSLPARAPRRADSGSVSLDSPRLRASHDALHRERDDLHQQLEAANRQLRSTRSFVEEQAAEREAERDEFARRLDAMRDENNRLTTRLQTNATILNEMLNLRITCCNCHEHYAHVEQLEAQTREMNTLIQDLESRKAAADEELKVTNEKILLLRDIIANLENQLEQKTAHEAVILEQLEEMRKTIDERDNKMRGLLGELESLRSERAELSVAVSVGDNEDRTEELMERIKEQGRWLEEKLHRRTRRLERVHETCSAPCSEPSEDVSLRDRQGPREAISPGDASPRWPGMPELLGVFEAAEALSRAEDAALKRIADLDMQRAQLTDVAQEVRAERDVLQARMSEQALKISSLSARLETQRNNAEALAHQAAHQLTVSLHDALAEVQRLKEELDSKDKQLLRAKQNLDEKEKLNERHQALYGNSCNPKDKVIILERELSATQTRIGQLEALAKSLEQDKDELQASLRDHQRALAEREEQLQEIMALKLDDDQKEDEPEGKVSARTLSDIVSISEFDEQDLQMRRAELKAQNLSLSGIPYGDNRDKTQNRTLPPDVSKPNISSLNLDFIDHFDLPSCTPRAESLPLTSTQNKDRFKRNANETTVFGTAEKFENVKHSTAQNIADNCSLYPNREVDDSKDVSVAPKKIDFSAEPSHDNRSHDDEFTSLRELGITLDIRQENFPDILTQLKHEIKKSRSELDTCKSELKNAEEQLCEFPALKEEVEELKGLLENTMATMENDKKFYENQLEHFSSNKTLLEQRVNELTQEVNEKSKDLHLLKEDILRRENMILELAKEKRNLTNKMTELEVKIDEIQSRNNSLEKCETENRILKEKISELQKLEQLVSEKNQQIDSLNQHLDRLDDMQRRLNDKTEELDNLKEAFEEKSNELFRLQDTIDAQHRDIDKINEENNNLNVTNKELKLKLTKLEKEQENASLKLQNSETELERVNSLNNELTAKIDELKDLTDKLKDKETEIDILNEDINSYHEEIASLKEQMKMVSRSPSPKSKSEKGTDRQASNDKKQLAKIRKQISLLQHELDFNRKELNDKAFELAKAKLDVTELRNSLSQATKQAADGEEFKQQAEAIRAERDRLAEQLQAVSERIREESDVTELKMKLHDKAEKCQELEAEVQDLRDLVDRVRETGQQCTSERSALVVSGTRSPTAELERALRDQLDYSHQLDQDIMEQILSGSSDEHEDIPRLALNSSKSSSSIHSTSSDRMNRLKSENDKLVMQVNNLEARLKDKDALITELNRIRDKLVQDWQAAKLRLQAEKDNCGRLQLLLLTHKESADTLQNQDSNMIQILKKRLESAMQSELELQQRETQHKARLATLERQLMPSGQDEPNAKLLYAEQENSERLRGEISLLKSKLEVERTRAGDTQALLDHSKAHFQKELEAKTEQCHALRTELAELRRLKHDAGVELLRAKELLNIQSGAIAELEQKMATQAQRQRPINDALTEIESHKTELAREITNLRVLVTSPELSALRDARQELASRVDSLQAELRATNKGTEEKDQAIRYLHNRCLKLESCRKALVWQKRYLQRVVAGYNELERSLRLTRAPEQSTGKKRFKCVAMCVIVVLRMGFLVRRRAQLRALSATAILRPRTDNTPSSPKPTDGTPASRPRTRARDTLARRVLDPDRTLHSPATPQLGDFIRRSYSSNSQHDDSFGLSTPRGGASAYLDKLGLVSRCLNHAMDASRDVP
ncbi:227 kDa spindle- and centromere-associated protein-like [Cydia amplana]|uniref:227 kDa spindle- and centromere-associated protein-like n=1 Tax=Cydia amplana TaxID=1869771 RepID=UPI002FE589FA